MSLMSSRAGLALTASVAASVIFLSINASGQPADNSSKATVSLDGAADTLTLPGEQPKAKPATLDQIAQESGKLAKNDSPDETTYQRGVPDSITVIRPFAQAEDGQGRYQSVQELAQQSVGRGSNIEGREPPMQAPVAIGRPGGVTNELDLALGQRQVYSDLRSLHDRITLQQRPIANAVMRYSTQSDGVDISRQEISQDFFFAEGASRLRPGVQLVKYAPNVGNGVFGYSGGVDGSYRINDFSAITGDFWLNEIEPKNFSNMLMPTYDLYLTLWPNDWIRMDLDTKRETFDNIKSLQMGITAESVGASIDYTPTDDLRFTIRAGGSFYSDTNDRESGEAEAIWRVRSQPTVEIGVRASAFSFSKQLNNGYFNPDTYSSGEAMVRLQTDLTDRLNVEAAASAGVENSTPGGNKPLVKTSLQFVYRLVENWSLDGGISYFSSQQSNSSGFARTSYTLGLHYRFD
jgi:hypothetical protein